MELNVEIPWGNHKLDFVINYSHTDPEMNPDTEVVSIHLGEYDITDEMNNLYTVVYTDQWKKTVYLINTLLDDNVQAIEEVVKEANQGF